MESTETKVLVNELCRTLDCSQRVLASLIGLSPHTLSNNQEKPLEQLTPRTRSRLVALYFIVVEKLGLLRSEAILDVIQAHVFPDIHDRVDSIVSAIQQDKYPLETLAHIAEISRNRYNDKVLSNRPRVSDGINLSTQTSGIT